MASENPLGRVKHNLKVLVSQAENWWFDKTRGIDTSGYIHVRELTVVGSADGALDYQGTRARTLHLALRRAQIGYPDYCFVDIGSGKGRILLVAAEYPFRGVEGVEFGLEMHRQAEKNIATCRGKRKCRNIQSLHANALDYIFPAENLVLYFANPFGPKVMAQVLANLEESLRQNPRDVLVVLAWPVLAPVVRGRAGWRPVEENARYCIYRATEVA